MPNQYGTDDRIVHARRVFWPYAVRGRRLLVIEIGAGFNTPSVIRWPCEVITARNASAWLILINPYHPVPGSRARNRRSEARCRCVLVARQSGLKRPCWVSMRSGFRVPPELLKNAPSHHTFSGVEPKHASCDFTNRAERFDYSAIKPEMVVPPVHPGIE